MWRVALDEKRMMIASGGADCSIKLWAIIPTIDRFFGGVSLSVDYPLPPLSSVDISSKENIISISFPAQIAIHFDKSENSQIIPTNQNSNKNNNKNNRKNNNSNNNNINNVNKKNDEKEITKTNDQELTTNNNNNNNNDNNNNNTKTKSKNKKKSKKVQKEEEDYMQILRFISENELIICTKKGFIYSLDIPQLKWNIIDYRENTTYKLMELSPINSSFPNTLITSDADGCLSLISLSRSFPV